MASEYQTLKDIGNSRNPVQETRFRELEAQMGGGGSSSYNIPTLEEYIKAITDTLPEPPPRYDEVNPFYFDEQWANEYATAEFSPYFDEKLSEYMTDVETTKKRLGDDTSRFLTEMEAQKDTFMQRSGRELDKMIRGIKEGYESSGLYFSGMKNRDIKEAQDENQFDTENFMRQYQLQTDEAKLDQQRKLEDLNLGSGRYQRDIGREKDAAIAGQVQQLKGEAMDEYLLGAQTYYSQPNWASKV